ncbi:MAG: isochorismatase family protein [Candidatus Geothermincolia bacterium]
MDDGWDLEDELFFDETGLVERGDCVLVVIDVQEKLLAVMSDKDAVLENATKLVRFANITGLPVLVTEQEKLGPTVPSLADEIKDFEPIMKLDFDAYQVPQFVKKLVDLDRETVILVGIESHICVTQTALSLLPLFDVHVIADAVSSRTPENKQVALERMRVNGATVSSTEMFMYEVLKKAGTEEFKATLKLIK